jgi:hypothetical protein
MAKKHWCWGFIYLQEYIFSKVPIPPTQVRKTESALPTVYFEAHPLFLNKVRALLCFSQAPTDENTVYYQHTRGACTLHCLQKGCLKGPSRTQKKDLKTPTRPWKPPIGPKIWTQKPPKGLTSPLKDSK